MNFEKIYILVYKGNIKSSDIIISASANRDVIVNKLIDIFNKGNDPSYYRIKTFDSRNGDCITREEGEDIILPIQKEKVLTLPPISFTDLVDCKLNGDDYLETDSLQVVIKLCDKLKKGEFRAEVYEEDKAVYGVRFLFSEIDYTKILRDPAYMPWLLENGSCRVTVEDTSCPYKCGKIRFGN